MRRWHLHVMRQPRRFTQPTPIEVDRLQARSEHKQREALQAEAWRGRVAGQARGLGGTLAPNITRERMEAADYRAALARAEADGAAAELALAREAMLTPPRFETPAQRDPGLDPLNPVAASASLIRGGKPPGPGRSNARPVDGPPVGFVLLCVAFGLACLALVVAVLGAVL